MTDQTGGLIKDRQFFASKNSCKCRSGWLEAVPGVEHGDKGLAGPTP